MRTYIFHCISTLTHILSAIFIITGSKHDLVHNYCSMNSLEAVYVAKNKNYSSTQIPNTQYLRHKIITQTLVDEYRMCSKDIPPGITTQADIVLHNSKHMFSSTQLQYSNCFFTLAEPSQRNSGRNSTRHKSLFLQKVPPRELIKKQTGKDGLLTDRQRPKESCR
jgi:hypothetical protein